MEVKNPDLFFPMRFDNTLDYELDTVGVILDSPMICGNCMGVMEKSGGSGFHCKNCGTLYIIKGR